LIRSGKFFHVWETLRPVIFEISPLEAFFAAGPQIATDSQKTKLLNAMLFQFIFRQLSAEKQVGYLQKNGVSLGSRAKNGRRIYVYMMRNLFVEVMYENDDVNSTPEKVNLMRGLKNLNAYLEKEFRASF